MNRQKDVRVKSNQASKLALDIGGTWTRAACVASGGQIRAAARERTLDQGSADDFIDQCVRMLTTLPVGASDQPDALGVSVTGPVDVETGILFRPPNTGPALDGLRVRELLSSRLGVPVVVEKDTNAAALAEQRYGAAQDARTFVYLTVSTGVGASVVLDGRLMRGADGTAGEFGHVVVDPNGPVCGCGRQGCLEAIASGPAIAQAGERSVAADDASHLARTARALAPARLEGHHVAASAAAGDLAAQAVMVHARRALVSVAVDLVNVINPEVLVMGGSVVDGNPEWVEAAAEAVREQALAPAGSRVRVRAAALGDDGGLLGAALLVAHVGS